MLTVLLGRASTPWIAASVLCGLALTTKAAAQDAGPGDAGVSMTRQADAGVPETPDAAPGGAASAPRTATLSWVRLPGAESCPSTQEVARAVEARLARHVFVSAAASELAVEGRIEVRASGGFVATMSVADAQGAMLGDRTLEHEGPECAQILEALTLTIALMIDPEAALGGGDEGAPGEEHEESAESSPAEEGADPSVATDAEPRFVTTRADGPREESATPVAADEDDPEPGWILEIAPSLAGVIGLSPNATSGGSLSFALTPPGFVPIILHGALFPWSRADPPMAPAIDVLQGYVGVQICPLAVRETAPVSIFACAGVDVGAFVLLSSRDAVREAERVTIQGDVTVSVHVALIGPLFLHVDLSLVVPFRIEPFLLDETPARAWFTPDPVAGVLRLGVGFEFDLGA